jgi:hypothetical protein
MKSIKILLFAIIANTILSCSKDDKDSNASCNEIVCGGVSGVGTYIIFRGTINPDTCGQIELEVNKATFNYYQAKWQANPEGYCCWEGLK